MAINDFFKPVWENSDLQVRSNYLENLKTSQDYLNQKPKIIKILKKMAIEDPNEDIRKKAIGMLKNYSDLKEVLFSSKTASMKNIAQNELNAIIPTLLQENPNDEKNQSHELLSLINDQGILKEIVLTHPSASLKKSALNKISEPNILSELFVTELAELLLEEIIEKTNIYSSLKEIYLTANQKEFTQSIKDKVFQKISTYPEFIEEEERQRLVQKVEEMIANLEKEIIRLKDEQTFNQNPDVYLEQWASLHPTISPDKKIVLEEKFLVKHQEYQTLYEEWEKDQQKEALIIQTMNQLANTLEGLHGLGQKLENLSNDQTSLEQVIKQYEEIILKLDKTILEDTRIANAQKQFSSTRQEIEKLFTELKLEQEKNNQVIQDKKNQLNEIIHNIKNLKKDNHLQSIKKKLQSYQEQSQSLIDSQSELIPLKEEVDKMVTSVEEHIKNIIEQQELAAAKLKEEFNHKTKDMLSKLEEFLNQLGKEENSKNENLLKESSFFFSFQKEISSHQDLLEADLASSYKENIQQLENKKKEIEENIEREYLSNLTEREKLCSVLEEIENLEDKEKLVELVVDAKKKWITMGPIRKQEYEKLYPRFQAICQKILDNCPAQVELYEQKIQNEISHKSELIKQLKEINLASENLNEKDWKIKNNKVSEIIDQWKNESNLHDFKIKKLNQQFKKELNDFFEKKKSFYQSIKENKNTILDKKKQLLQTLESYLTSSEEWYKLRSKLIGLVKDWIQLGSGFPYKDNKELDKNFYEKYEQVLKDHHEGLDSRIQLKDSLWQEFNQIINPDSQTANDSNPSDKPIDPPSQMSKEQVAQILTIKSKWDKVAFIPLNKYKSLNHQFYKSYHKVVDKYQEFIKEIEEEKNRNAEEKSKLLEELKSLLDSKDNKDHETTQKIIKIQNQWNEIGEIPRYMIRKIEKPFHQITSQFFKEKKKFYKQIHEEKSHNFEKKNQLLVRLDYLLKTYQKEQPQLSNPENQIEQLKMAWQMNQKLNSLDNKNGNTNFNKIMDELNLIKSEWKKTGRTSNEKEMNDKFYSIIRKFKSK